MTTYDDWKTHNPADDYFEQPADCTCIKHEGDDRWCPIHGEDPDYALEEQKTLEEERLDELLRDVGLIDDD